MGLETEISSSRVKSRAAIFTKSLLILLFLQAGTLFAVCQALTSDYSLTGNETSAGTCFTLNADNITLDCNGYTISITGGTAAPSIDVNAVNTTIRNCVVRDTSATNVAMGAIRLRSNADSTKVLNTTVFSAGHYSLYVQSQGNNFTDDNFTTTTQNAYGAYFSSSSNNVLTNVLFNKTATANTYSLYWYYGDANTFTNVTVDSSNTRATAIYSASLYGVTNSNFTDSHFIAYNQWAVGLQGGSTGNRFSNADVSATSTTAAYGFYIDFSPSNTIVNSNVNVSGVGIYVLSSSGDTRMENLTITTNASSGIYVQSTTGTSDANIINNVTVTALNYPLSFYQGSNNNVVENSTFLSTANNAFFSNAATAGNSFVNNTFRSRLSGGNSFAFYFTASSSSNNIIRNNNITSPTYYGVYFAGTGSSNNVIDSNNITAVGTAGYGVTFAAASSNSNNITNNNISAMGYGVQVYGDYNNIMGNNISAVTIGIYLPYSTYANVSNNYVRTNSTAGANAIIYMTSSDSNYVSNNTLLHTGVTLAINYGILVSTSSSNEFYDNNISTFANDGIRVTSTSNSNIFRGNTIYTNATNYYGIMVTTNCNYNRFNDNNVTSVRGYGAAFVTNSKYNQLSGGSIQAYTQAGFTINSANNNTVANTTISSGIGAAGSYGIYLTVTSGNRISNVSIAVNGSYGIYMTGGVSSNVVDNVSVYSYSSYAFYANPDVSFNTFSNFNFTSRAAIAVYTNGNPTPITGNSFTNGTIWANVSNSQALYLYYSSTNNNFTNVDITNAGDTGARAIYLLQSSTGNIFTNVTATAANAASSYGVLAQTGSTSNFFYNSTIVAPFSGTGYDVYVGNTAANPSSVIMVNSTFDQFSVAFGDTSSYLNVSWYLRANVTDLSGAIPIEGANVSIYDSFGTRVSSTLTDSNGLSAWSVAKQYKQVSGSSTNFYPYNFTVTVGTAEKNQTLSSLASSTTQGIAINASTCGLLSGDYILTNNVFGSTGCFQAGGSGITLDCNGYSINYSRTGAGCAFSANFLVGLTLKNCRFVQGAYLSNASSAICLSSSANATVANSTITASGSGNGYDFNLTSGAEAYALNVTTSPSNSYFSGSSRLYRQWYVRVNLTDMSGAPLPVAHVNITDAFNATAASAEVTDGQSPVMILVQYMQTGASNYTNFSNFTILGYTGVSSNTTLLPLSGNAEVSLQINASTCGVLTQSTTLRNNVYSNGTCFVAGSSGITLDCAGYSVNYSRSGDGFYGFDTSGYSNVTAVNCNFTAGNQSASNSYAIHANGSNDLQIYNSTLSGNAAAFNSSSRNARFVNTTFDNSTVDFRDSDSDMSVEWYATVHVVGLANEDIASAQVNVTNADGAVADAATGANGRAIFLLEEYSRNQSGVAHSDPYNFTAQHPVTLMTASNNTALPQSSNITLQVISASINVDSPTENQIFFQGETVNITVNVTMGESWVTNATVQVVGDATNSTYQAIQVAPGIWNYSYNIDPSQPSATMTINARGYNGSAFVSATRNFVVTRTSGSGIAQPVVNYFCPLYTYNLQNTMTDITAIADLDTVLYSMALTVTYPDGSTATPSVSDSSADMVNYIYNYTWQLNATQEGNYTLYVEARDVNDNRVNLTRRLFATPSNATINLSAAGISELYLKDTCSGAVVLSGADLTGVSAPPGNYSLLAVDPDKANITFNDFNATSYSGAFLNYSRESASGLPTPENRRNIFLFSSTINGGAYSSAGILFNYSSDAGTLVAENSLEIDNCASRANCSWSLLNATLNTSSKLINTTVTTLGGLYGTFEPAFATPTPQPVYAAYPVISRFAPEMQNVLLGTNVTIYLDAKLEANLSVARANATYPLGTFQNLTSTSITNGSNYTYNYTYSLVANETGIYTLRARVGDQYYQNTSAIAYLNVVASNVTAAITSYGITSSALVDSGTGTAVMSGADSISGNITPGNYTYLANASSVRFTLNNMEVNGGALQALNYTSLAQNTVAPPNRSGVQLFYASNFSINFTSAQVVVDYSAQAGSVISEIALEVWTCPSTDCASSSMTRVNATINTAAHTATFNATEFSGVYGVYQPFLTVITPIQAAPPAAVRFTTDRQNAVLYSNVTVYLDLQLGTNFSSAVLNLTRPSGSWSLLSNSSFSNGSNYTYNLTYWLIANETGNYTLVANVSDGYGQSSQFTHSFSAAPTTGFILTSYGMANTSVLDSSTGATLFFGGGQILNSTTPGAYTYIAVSNESVVEYNISALQISGGAINVLNHTNLSTSAVLAPANRSALYVFSASDFSAAYSSAKTTMDYSSMIDSILSEPALEVWSCASVSDCANKTRLNTTINTLAHTISFTTSGISGVYGIYQPSSASIVTPIQVALPQITRLAPSKANAVQNENITIYLDMQLGANLSSATLNLTRPSGASLLLSNSSYSAGANYTYNTTYWFVANETGTYSIFATATDSYGQSANASSQVSVASFNSNIIVTSYGLDNSSIIDTAIGATVASGGSVLSVSLPLGQYNYNAVSGNTTILLRSLLVNGNMNVLNYTNLSSSAVAAPANRSAVYIFSASNFSVAYSSVQVTMNYSGLLGNVVSEQALEVWTCASVSNCPNMTKLASSIDTTTHTASFNLSGISGVYGLYNPAQAVATPVNVAAPAITSLVPSLQNAVPGTNITVYLEADLGANFSFANVSFTPPSGVPQYLSNESFSEGAGNAYSLAYSFIANDTGAYSINATVGDIYGQNASANFSALSVAAPINATITSYGVNSTLLADPAMGASVLSGAGNLSGSIAPGNYTLYANTSSVGFTFGQFGVEGDLQALSFTELDITTTNLTSPSNRTQIYLFDASNYSANFSYVQVVINYTSYLGSVISEPALEVWTCHDVSNCTLSQIAATVDQSANTITFTLPSLSSAYALCQASSVMNITQNVTQIVVQYVPSGGSTHTVTKEVPVEKNVTKEVVVEKTIEVPVNVYTTVRLLAAPDLLELHPQNSADAKVTLTNGFGADMGKVMLSAQSTSPDVTVSLESSTFELPANSEASTIMHVQASKKTGTFGIKLVADAEGMGVKDEMNVPVVVSYNLDSDRELTKKNVDFANKLLAENPECQDLKENIMTAAAFMDSGKYAEADSKAQAAISGCSGLMALRGKPTVQTQLITQLNLPLVAISVVVLTGLVMASILGFMMLRDRNLHMKKEHRYHSARKPETYQRDGSDAQYKPPHGGYSRDEGNDGGQDDENGGEKTA
ncbi:MAG: right-handed parallel beta-helix repeat-containing protein [Candidatus Micrarchaeia archaeon]